MSFGFILETESHHVGQTDFELAPVPARIMDVQHHVGSFLSHYSQFSAKAVGLVFGLCML